jgi:hypothetical protein
VTHETKHFIYFYLGQVAILCFKSGWVCKKNLWPLMIIFVDGHARLVTAESDDLLLIEVLWSFK